MELKLSEPSNEEDTRYWINADEQEITDEMIVNKENESRDDYEDSDDENRHVKISHTDGPKVIEKCY